jgi:ABC-type multidrug transport system fused ATPase/permease subunit
LLKAVRKIASLEKRLFWINFGLFFLVGLSEALSVFSLAPLVDLFVGGAEGSLSSIAQKVSIVFNYFGFELNKVSASALLLFSIMCKNIFLFIQQRVALQTKYRVLERIYSDSLSDFYRGGMFFFNSVKSGVIVNTLTKEVAQIGNSFFTLITMLSSIIRATFYIIPSLLISLNLTFFIFIFFGVAYLPSILLNKKAYRLGVENTASANQVQVDLDELLTSTKVILGFGLEKATLNRFFKTFSRHVKATIPFQTVGFTIPLIYEPVFMGALIAVLFVSTEVLQIEFSSVLVILYAVRSAVPQMISAISSRNLIEGIIPSFEQIEKLRNKAEAFFVPEGEKVFEGFKKHISFENVCFRYTPDEPGIKDANFKINKGERVAIVGASGAGKTTLVDLIMGLYPPNSGQVRIDGVDLKEYSSHGYRQKMSYVSQEPYLFNVPLEENFRYINPDIKEEQLREACTAANILDLFLLNRNKLAGSRGANLSGGERQRLCLARALARKSNLLILDEVTSSLDRVSEGLINQYLENLPPESTVVVITHKLQTIKEMDKVIFIDNGKIESVGTFSQVLAENSRFAHLVNP